MRIAAALLILAAAAAPAAAQAPAPGLTLQAMRRDFPLDHQAIDSTLIGKPPEEARRLAYAGIDRFLRSRRSAILAAPGPTLVALEARQGAILRALAKQDVRLCAAIADRGFFIAEAAAAAAPPGFDAYGVALVEAAKAGAGSVRQGPAPTAQDVLAWQAALRKIEPEVPVWEILSNRNLRSKSSPDQLCRASAAMHEAVAALPGERGERIARTVLSSVIGSAGL